MGWHTMGITYCAHFQIPTQIGGGRYSISDDGSSSANGLNSENENNVEGDDDDDDLDARDDGPLDQYCKVIGVWERSRSRSRATRTEEVEVRFDNFNLAHRPESLLSRCLQHLLDRLLEGREQPMRIGLACQPATWDHAYYIPQRPPQQNSADAMAQALQNLERQYEGLNLFSGDVRFKITAVWPLGAASSDAQGGCGDTVEAARGTVRCASFQPVVTANDNWCMARAIVLGMADRRIRVLQRRPLADFQAFCRQQRAANGAALAQQLLIAAGVPLNLPAYGVAEACRVQHLLDAQLGAGQVRLVLFERESAFRIVWKGPLTSRWNICLVLQNGHYGYIARIEQLFHARKYCVDCEQLVDRRTHPQGCRAVCRLCFRFGWGMPCQRPPGEQLIRCDECQFVFVNQDCFEAHRRRVDPPPPGWEHDRRYGRPHRSMCEERRICTQCQQIRWARAGRHICGRARHPPPPPQQLQGAVVLQQGGGRGQQPLGTPPPLPYCDRCQGQHDPAWTPHFIQPANGVRQFPLERRHAVVVGGDDDDDDAVEEEEQEEEAETSMTSGASDVEGQEDSNDDDDGGDNRAHHHHRRQQQPRRRQFARKNRPIRFLFWDVECEQQLQDANDGDGEDEDDDHAWVAGARLRKHIPILVCAEVICERCIADGVDVERDANRRAAGCCCGVPWRGPKRRRWSIRMGEDAFSSDEDVDENDDDGNVAEAGRRRRNNADGEQGGQRAVIVADGYNPRRLRFFRDPVTGQGPMEQFCEFLLHTGPLNICTLMLAHNGGRYDVHLMLEELQRRGVRPRRLISTGLRVYTLQLGGKNQRMILAKDSLNFYGCALSKLPAMFALRGCPDKPYFPYRYIREANMDVIRRGLPPATDYDPDRMRPAERAAFLHWYAEQQPHQRPFQLRRELLRYCANDVRILRMATLRFREIIGQLADGMEPFMAATTIASLALAIYRQCYLPRDQMVHTPEGGFLRGRRASAASRHFFALLERQRPEWRGRIRTAQWSIGEECVEDDGYRLDAIIRRTHPLPPLVVEYCGCYFHGCPECYPQRQQRLAGEQSAEQLYERTRQRAWVLETRHGYEVQHVWECEFRELLRTNLKLRRIYADECRAVPAPMDLRRDALFGGRVEPFALHYVCGPEEEIDDLDIVSLYPYVMKYREFPVGLPRVITAEQLWAGNDNDINIPPVPVLPWRRAEDNPFRGFILCRVLAPTPAQLGDRFAVLPYRTRNGRLTFPLCRICAELGNANENNNNRRRRRRQGHRPIPRCRHTEAQRAWVHAYTHCELNAALERGYRVLQVYEVWHYEQWTSLEAGNSLFADYVNSMLRIKVESSGWPPECRTDEQRNAFVQQYREQEGIAIDPQRVCANPGLRAVAKALLNALWGKLAQRAERDEIEYTGSAREFHDLLADPTHEMVDFVHLNEKLDRCVVRKRHPFVEAPPTNNLSVACFVTSHARIYLLERLEEVQRSGGRPIYCDTDSVLFVKRRGAPRLACEGDALGQMKREWPGRRIFRFISGGPKNYAFAHACATSGEDVRAERKVRGIQLTYQASEMLPFDRMCRLVLNYFGRRPNTEQRVSVPCSRFVRNKRADIFTRPSHKLYQPVYTKGIVVAVPQNEAADDTLAYFTRPFGWYDADDADDDQAEEEEDAEMEEEEDDDEGAPNGEESE